MNTQVLYCLPLSRVGYNYAMENVNYDVLGRVLRPGIRMLVVGDDFVDGARRSDLTTGLGNGFVRLLDAATRSLFDPAPVWINRGNDGDGIRELNRRLQSDILDERPDWLIVAVGTNDALYAISDRSATRQKHVDLFIRHLTRLLREARRTNGRLQIVLIEPGCCPDELRIDEALRDFATAINLVAMDFDAPVVPFRRMSQSRARSSMIRLTTEEIFPNREGHKALARATLDVIASG